MTTDTDTKTTKTRKRYGDAVVGAWLTHAEIAILEDEAALRKISKCRLATDILRAALTNFGTKESI